jgi:hypothetical protein
MSQHNQKPGGKPESAHVQKDEGFMGKAPFAKALLAPDNPMRKSKEERQIASSEIILDVVEEAVAAKKVFVNYGRCLLREATKIANSRKAETTAPEQVQVENHKPATKREALARALATLAPGAKITKETPSKIDGSITMFSVSWNNEEYRIPLRDTLMERDDPVAEARMMAKALAIGWTTQDARERTLGTRKASRPDCSPLGVAQKDLDERYVTYDGEMMIVLGEQALENDPMSWNTFTYLVNGMETTFTSPTSITGEALLRSIESKIIGIHMAEFGDGKTGKAIPIPEAVLESLAGRMTPGACISEADNGVRIAAMTLDHMAVNMNLPLGLVPEKYRDSYIQINNLPLPRTVVLTKTRRDELKTALDELDHGGYAMVRAMYRTYTREDGSLDPEGLQVIKDTLRTHQSLPGQICERALRNLAKAYGKMTDDAKLESAGIEELESKHFLMAYTIRRGLTVISNDRIIIWE